MNELIMDCESKDSIEILHLQGHLAQLEVYKLKNKLEAIWGEGKRFIVLNLNRLTILDSAGLGALNALNTESLQHDAHITRSGWFKSSKGRSPGITAGERTIRKSMPADSGNRGPGGASGGSKGAEALAEGE